MLKLDKFVLVNANFRLIIDLELVEQMPYNKHMHADHIARYAANVTGDAKRYAEF